MTSVVFVCVFVCEQETSDPTWHSKAIKLCDRVLEVKEEERFKVDEIDPNNVPASGCCYYTLLFRILILGHGRAFFWRGGEVIFIPL